MDMGVGAKERMKVVIIVLLPINMLYVYHIMCVTLYF